MKYTPPLAHEEKISVASYLVGRVCEADDPSITPETLPDIPREATQAALETRVEGLDGLDQGEYDELFEQVHSLALAQINA